MPEHILIVDDEPSIRDSMQQFIERSGFNSFAASSAEEALELLHKNKMQIVITDIRLPGKNGLELTEIIKQDHDADVIVMTGFTGAYSYEEAINKGASDLVFKPVRFDELLLRVKRVLKERRSSKERIQMLEKLKELAITDGLTNLYNSRHFYNQLKSEIDRSNRYGHPVALLLLDIDNFKQYNDAYGHIEGDKVLVRLGQVIKLGLRTPDSAYRYGGEEFTVILPQTTGKEADTVAQRIRIAIKAEIFYPASGEAKTITISVGVTEYVKNEAVTAFVQRADKAMYLSKEHGRNRVSSLFAGEVS
ncbi:diguanylate cyclase [Thermodesulfobacteriota bacterium]